MFDLLAGITAARTAVLSGVDDGLSINFLRQF
jgi:hypothetical protein